MELRNRPDISSDVQRLRFAFVISLFFALLLWMVKLVEIVDDLNFVSFVVAVAKNVQ